MERKSITRKSSLPTKAERGREDPLMNQETEGGEAPPMMIGDTEKGVTPEIEEITMEAAGLGGEGTAGRVSVSRGFLLQAPLLP